MKNVEFYVDESGRCRGEDFQEGNRKQLQRRRDDSRKEKEKGGCKMLTIKYFPCGDSLKVSYFSTIFIGKKYYIVFSKFKMWNMIKF